MWSMIKDRHGLLWLGLEQTGVAVFDGFRFRLYGLADGLASGDVQALFEDADGQIWAGTGKGLALWNGKGFTRVTDGIPDAQVNAIQAGPGGTLWVATAAGLYKRVSGLKFAPVEGWPGGEATALHAARDGKT
jgi:ligand-binding sensor domain-containing protein